MACVAEAGLSDFGGLGQGTKDLKFHNAVLGTVSQFFFLGFLPTTGFDQCIPPVKPCLPAWALI